MAAESGFNKWLAGIGTAVFLAAGAGVLETRIAVAKLQTTLDTMQADRIARIEASVLRMNEMLIELRLRNAAWEARWPELADELEDIQANLDASMFVPPVAPINTLAAPPDQ